MNNMLRNKIETHILDCYKKETFTHCSVAVIYKDKLEIIKNFENGIFVEHKIYYDLASITKPMITMPIILQLLDKYDIDLFDYLYPYFIQYQSQQLDLHWMKKIRFFDLLTHTSGLPPVANPSLLKCYNQDCSKIDTNESINYILTNKPVCESQSKIVYSCVNFLLLGIFAYSLEQKSMDELIDLYITKDEELIHTPKNMNLNFAPTEYSNLFKRHLCGEIHDLDAFFMNGIAGNAGAFSTIEFYYNYINAFKTGVFEGKNIIPKKYLSMIKEEQTKNIRNKIERRSLGFRLNESTFTSGKYLSENAFGHTGYTGTECIIDESNKLTIIAFTNRVYFSREIDKISYFRTQLNKIIIEQVCQ